MASYDPAIHHRRSIRLRGYDYTRPGEYFVTCRTQGRRPLFGTIVNGRMALNAAGRMVRGVWDEMPAHYPGVECDYYEIIVRDAAALAKIRAYIRDNPAHADVRRFGEPRPLAGNPALLHLPLTAVSAQRAAWCNQYVLHTAARIVVGHLAPEGMLAVLLSDLPDDKPVTVLAR